MAYRPVKSITVEYADDSVETYQGEEMFHKDTSNYPGGAHPRPESGFISHEIRWTEKRSNDGSELFKQSQ